LEIVKADGLQSLLRLLQSTYLPLILSSAACVRNVSIHPQNESPIIESGFLQPLINLLSFKDNEEVQCHAISTLRNLAASSEKNKKAIVKAGAVQSIKELVLEVPLSVQSEMTACVAVLALSGTFQIVSTSALYLRISNRRTERPAIRDGSLRSPYSTHKFSQLRSSRQQCRSARQPVVERHVIYFFEIRMH
jgi:hypothetical protein